MARKFTKTSICYEDRRQGLRWEKYNKKRPEDFIAFNEYVNTWSQAKNVQEYITRRQPLAEYLIDFINTDDEGYEGLYYCFQKDNLVGVVYMCAPIPPETHSNIEYLVVDPRKQGKGYATRMIASIKENPTFFTGSRHQGIFKASVHNTNEASLKVFIKNGFEVLKPVYPTTSSNVDGVYNTMANFNKFTRLFFQERALIDDQSSEMVDDER